MRLSTSTGDFKVGTMPIEEQIAWIAKAGFCHINLEMTTAYCNARLNGNDWEERIEAFRRSADESKVDFVLAHSTCAFVDDAGYDKLVEETGRNMVACDRLGIPDLVVHPLYRSDLSVRGMYDYNKQFYSDLLIVQPDTKVRLLIENTGDMECPFGFASGAEMADFLDWMANPRLGACLDTSHLSQNKAPRDDQYESILALRDWLRAVHISDSFGNELHWHSIPFSGIINFDSIMCGLLEIGYKGAFNYEASYILRNSKMPPLLRKEWTHPNDPNFTPRLFEPPVDLVLEMEKVLYKTGKYILEQYNVFED